MPGRLALIVPVNRPPRRRGPRRRRGRPPGRRRRARGARRGGRGRLGAGVAAPLVGAVTRPGGVSGGAGPERVEQGTLVLAIGPDRLTLRDSWEGAAVPA